MKIHIENLNITLSHPPTLAGLISTQAISGALKTDSLGLMPAIGEKWPGLDAVYAGVALSQNEDSLVHLVLWDEDLQQNMSFDKAIMWAEKVNPDMNSHVPTRQQSITLFENVRDNLNTDCWHWTSTKTKSGNAAFSQDFHYGDQDGLSLSAELRVRAVSEIPL